MKSPINPQIGISKVEKVLAGWSTGQRSLLTLADMIAFAASDFVSNVQYLAHQDALLRERIKKRAGHPSLVEKERLDLSECVEALTKICDHIGMDRSGGRAWDLYNRLKKQNGLFDCSIKIVQAEIAALIEEIEGELSLLKFVCIPILVGKFYDRKDLFGKEVSEMFPEATEDLRNAGTCIALELNNSAIYHLMKVVEYGARRLARRVRVKFGTKIQFVEGFDISTLGQVANKIDEAIKSMKQKKGSVSPNQLRDANDYYTGLQMGLVGMLNVWRNPVSHVRGVFQHQDAIHAYHHAERFMRTLASKKPRT